MIDLRLGDCLDVMVEIPDGSIDLILADLPYGTTACKWDTVIPFEPLWAHYRRLLKPRGAVVLTASQPFTSMLVMSNREWFRHEWIWDKRQCGNPFLAKYQPLKVHESVLVFGDSPKYDPLMTIGRVRCKGTDADYSKDWGYGAKRRHRRISGEYYPKSILSIDAGRRRKVHPTQKPVALMEYLIRTYSNEGDTVLDNAMGSGTTGVACLNTGRRFIGIEKHEPYFAIAERRIAAARAEIEVA